MKNKKVNKILWVCLVVFLLGVFFFLGYVVSDANIFKFGKTNSTTNKANNSDKKEKKYSLLDLERSVVNYERLFDEAHNLDEVPKDKLYTLIFNTMYGRQNRSVTLDEFIAGYKKTIFNSIEIKPQNIGFDVSCMDLIQYKYNDSTKTFEYNELPGHDCGFVSFPVVANREIYGYEEKDNQYILTKYIVYSHPTPDELDNNNSRKYYRTFDDAKNGVNLLFEQDNSIDPFDITRSKFTEYTDKIQKVVYTFEDKNDVLTLVDYKIV